VWDLARGEALHTLACHERGINGAALLPDGRALSWSDDQTLRLTDIEHGVQISSYFTDAVLCTPAVDGLRGRIFCGDTFGRIHIISLDMASRPINDAR
jgi:WD40 repeat protein